MPAYRKIHTFSCHFFQKFMLSWHFHAISCHFSQATFFEISCLSCHFFRNFMFVMRKFMRIHVIPHSCLMPNHVMPFHATFMPHAESCHAISCHFFFHVKSCH